MRRAGRPALAAVALVGACGGDHLIGADLAGSERALFAIAYVSDQELREDNLAWSIQGAIGLVIATSRAGTWLELADLHVVAVTDDSPRLDVSLTLVGPADYRLPPGHAGGRLVGADKWVAPLVPEPRFEDRGPSLQLRVDYLDEPTHSFDATVHATAVLAAGGQEATLPFVFHVVSAGPLGARVLGARRVLSAPIGP